MTDLLSLSIVGAMASVITQLIKKKIPDGLPRAIVAIIIALVFGAMAHFIGFLPDLKNDLIGVLILSNVIYNMIVKNILPENKTK